MSIAKTRANAGWAWVGGVILTAAPGGAQGPPVRTDTPIMLGLEGRGVRTFLEVVRRDVLLDDGHEIPDPMDRSATIYLSPLAVPYNLTPTFQVGAILPFLTRSLRSGALGESRSGLGDVTFFAKKLLAQVDRKGETLRVAARGSLKLPTGEDRGTVPTGTGSVAYALGAVSGWIKGRWGLYGEAVYVHDTSSGETDYGDRIGYDAAAGFRVLPAVYVRYPSPQLNVYLELNGGVVGRTRVDGVRMADTGGAELFVAPGLQYVGGRRWLVEASLQLPLVNEPNGTQLGTRWSTRVGTRVLLF